MAHKKSLLTKYLSGTETSDCRSPRHNGNNWFIPETSLSGPSEPENRNTLNVNPGTSNQQEEEKSTSGGEKFPEDNLDDISVTVLQHLLQGKKFQKINLGLNQHLKVQFPIWAQRYTP